MTNRIKNHPITKEKPITVFFDNKQYQGYEGDSLASILLAHGVKLVGRSFKYHRPRGVLSAGSEEPNALVSHRSGAYLEPNTRATTIEAYHHLKSESQNRFPNLRFDLWAINSYLSSLFPSGFYYKTFMWPRKLWEPFYEKIIRHAAGLGKAAETQDPDSYNHKNHFCDILIAGAGLSGLTMAKILAPTGLRVTILDEDFSIGGSSHYQDATIDNMPIQEWAQKTHDELQQYANVTINSRTTITGYYDYNFLTALEKVTDHLDDHALQNTNKPRQRFWKIRAKKVIIATGLHERPLSFADNDRPGVLLASALGEYMKRYGVHLGTSIVLSTNNDSVYETALRASEQGIKVSVVDCRAQLSDMAQSLQDKITIYPHHVISQVIGKHGVNAAVIHALNDTEDGVQGSGKKIYCDYIGMSGGFTPALHLYSQGRGKLKFDDTLQAFFAHTIPQNCIVIGANAKQFTIENIYQDCVEKAQKIAQEFNINALSLVPLSYG